MAKTETLHIRVNEQVKTNAEETLDMLGISISEAVNMFLCQSDRRASVCREASRAGAHYGSLKDRSDKQTR